MNPAQYYYALRSILPKNLYNDARLASRKRECRAYLPSKVDPLAESLRKLPRKHIDEGGECCTEYRIVTDPMTDEEAQDLCDSMRYNINSPYDCTGRIFTAWISWKRVPCGIAIIHRMGLDV